MPVNSFEQYVLTWKPSWERIRPLYKSLARCLEEDIKAGRLLPGTKLPPQRELADYLDINVSTVSQAFRICSDKGLLTSLTGCGTFVAYDALTNLSVVPEPAADHIELGSMMPETMNTDEAAGLLRAMLDEPQAASLFQYSYGHAAWHRQTAASFLRNTGAAVAAEEPVVFANGGQNAIAAVLLAVCRPGDRLGVDPLVYPGVKQAAKLFGIRLIPIAHEGGEMTADGIRYAVQNHQIRELYVVPDFQNPTGHIMSDAGRRAIAQMAHAYGLFVIEDGITRPLASQPLTTIQALVPERTFFILSLSKVVLPALRMAYILCPTVYFQEVQDCVSALHLSQSELLAELTARLVASGIAQKLIRSRRLGVVRRNRIAEAVLQGYSLGGSAESLCRWLELPQDLTGRAVEDAARIQGVGVYGDDHFTVGAAQRYHGLRLAVTAPADENELAEGLRRLKTVIETI